jgi:hypothetical protein
MKVAFLPVMLFAVVAACASSGGFPEDLGIIPDKWRLVAEA